MTHGKSCWTLRALCLVPTYRSSGIHQGLGELAAGSCMSPLSREGAQDTADAFGSRFLRARGQGSSGLTSPGELGAWPFCRPRGNVKRRTWRLLLVKQTQKGSLHLRGELLSRGDTSPASSGLLLLALLPRAASRLLGVTRGTGHPHRSGRDPGPAGTHFVLRRSRCKSAQLWDLTWDKLAPATPGLVRDNRLSVCNAQKQLFSSYYRGSSSS